LRSRRHPTPDARGSNVGMRGEDHLDTDQARPCGLRRKPLALAPGSRASSERTGMSRKYKVVDVFTAQPLLGNPVAVVLDADGLDGTTMQQIARWTNLSETTFVLPPTRPGADYRLRIFTPGSELPFAGHPTPGSAHAVLESERVVPRDGRLVQECGAGLVSIAVSGSTRVLTLPAAQVTGLAPDDVSELEAILGAPVNRAAEPALVDVGPAWVVAQL